MTTKSRLTRSQANGFREGSKVNALFSWLGNTAVMMQRQRDMHKVVSLIVNLSTGLEPCPLSFLERGEIGQVIIV